MQDKLQKKLEDLYCYEKGGIDGYYPERAKPIIDFIDQNFIGKEELRLGIWSIREVIEKELDLKRNEAVVELDKLLELLK